MAMAHNEAQCGCRERSKIVASKAQALKTSLGLVVSVVPIESAAAVATAASTTATATTAAATAAAAATNGSARLPQLFRQLLFGDLLLHRRVDVRPLLEDGASDVNGPQYHAARLIANGVVPG